MVEIAVWSAAKSDARLAELLQELARRRVGGSLDAVPEGIEAGLELRRGVVELLLELVASIEIRRSELAELRDELVRRVPGLAELVAERVGRDRLRRRCPRAT